MASDTRTLEENNGEGHDFKGPLSPAPRQKETEGKKNQFGILKTPHFVCDAILKNQRDATWWGNSESLKRVRAWCRTLINELDIRVKDSEKLGVPLILIERMNVRTLGTYRPEADGYAIGGTIAINEERLAELPEFMEIVLLFVLLVRARQHQLGGNGCLDREGRELMKSKGLVVTEKGKITIADDMPFRQVLERNGVTIPAASEFTRPERRGKSTIRLWSCTCQKARVGKSTFLAMCPQCYQPFRIGDHVGKRFVETDESAVVYCI